MRDEWSYHWPLLLAIAICVCCFAIILAACSSNPVDDPNIVDCGNGYYARTKAQCP